jgi:hypothetical protein
LRINDEKETMKRIIRVFPRRTNATPDDDMVRVACEPGLMDEADEVHISVSWTWDIPLAERLEKLWHFVGETKIGGPALGYRSGEFVPGMYIKHGYTITSRGCPNKCWFCSVWKREGGIRELPICDGWNVLDDNLLACSETHIRAVFDMLKRQSRPIEFTGGWEAKLLKQKHVDLLKEIRLGQVWFAYDTDDDLEPLISAGKLLRDGGISITSTGNVSHRVRCYCLVGFPKDTFQNAENRLRETYKNGFLPMAMLYRDDKGNVSREWSRFQKFWARPASISRLCVDNVKAWK